MSAGLLLGDFGIDTLVIDKRTTISDLPRGRGILTRATEILRQLGIETQMVAAALPTSTLIETRHSLAYPPVSVSVLDALTHTEFSPCRGLTIAQDEFESVLRSHLSWRSTVELRLGVRLTDFTASGGEPVRAKLVDERTGATQTVVAKFLLGADGWRSEVRHDAGIEFFGDELGSQRSIRFRADLSAWLGTPPPVFVRLPHADAVLLPTHPGNHWVVTHAGAEDSLEPTKLICDLLGVDVAPEVLGDTRWIAGVRYADRFQRGPVFLLGDAAHRLTPAGASGISLAMADAHNLAWKLAGVLRGWAGPKALASYDQERGALGRAYCELNYQMWDDLMAGRPLSVDLGNLDMGYHYASPIVMPDPAHRPHSTASPYRPSAAPGARAPHVWLDKDAATSTLDFFGRGFVLVTTQDCQVWVDAARGLQSRSAVPLELLVVQGPDATAAYDLASGGAVLVRPDGHVAWRFELPSSGGNAQAELEQALSKAAGH